MTLTRRHFLKAGTMASLLAGTTLGINGLIAGQQAGGKQAGFMPGLQIPDENQMDALYYLSRSAFSEQLGETFRISTGALTAVDVRLIEVTDVKSSSPDEGTLAPTRYERFSILFRGPHATPLAQNTYTVEQDLIGTFALFLVPIGEDQDGRYYEAIFNRPRP